MSKTLRATNDFSDGLTSELKEIVVVGSGGMAKEVGFLIDQINRSIPTWKFLGYVDKNVGEPVGKASVIMNDDELLHFQGNLNVAIGVGFPALLKKLAERFKQNPNLSFPNLIHPSCIGDWDQIELTEGNLIAAGAIFTTDIKLGSFNIINTNVAIHHDVELGSHNVLNPTCNMSGGVKTGDQVLIGTGARVLQGLTIGDSVTLGAGAVLTKDALSEGVYIGCPARKIR